MSASVWLLLTLSVRPLRTSCWMVGILKALPSMLAGRHFGGARVMYVLMFRAHRHHLVVTSECRLPCILAMRADRAVAALG